MRQVFFARLALGAGVAFLMIPPVFAGAPDGSPGTDAPPHPIVVAAGAHYDPALLSKPIYRVKVEYDVKVPARDGTPLSIDIYRPDAPGRFPAILYRTPYNNDAERNIGVSVWFAKRGYVYIQEDVRGKYDSMGQFYPFRHEPDDGYNMDQWIGHQSWFNGKLGTMGGSYSGYTQWAQMLRGSSYLTATAPQFTTPDVYGNWFYIDGAFNYSFALSWGAGEIDGRVNESTGDAVDMMAAYMTLPIEAAPGVMGHRAPHFHDWISHPRRDAYWDGISFEHAYGKVQVPVISVDGWYDIFLRGALRDDHGIRTEGSALARRSKRLVIGPWIHGVSDSTNVYPGQPPAPDGVDFGAAANVDLNKVYLSWYDHWLKGIHNGAMQSPPIDIFVMGENKWRYLDQWPPKNVRYVNYYLESEGHANSSAGNGRLSTHRPGAVSAPTDAYVYDPRHPVPTWGGHSCCAALTRVGPHDQRPVEKRDDVLVFTTVPLRKTLEVTGPIELTLYAATTARDTDWTAKLVDVSPDGFARNVQSGILRARYRLSHRVGPGQLLTPNKVYRYTIDLWATSNAFLPGHRIRLEVSSSDFPHFDRNLNTGEDAATGTRMVVAHQTVYHSARYPSHLVLPVIPGS